MLIRKKLKRRTKSETKTNQDLNTITRCRLNVINLETKLMESNTRTKEMSIFTEREVKSKNSKVKEMQFWNSAKKRKKVEVKYKRKLETKTD